MKEWVKPFLLNKMQRELDESNVSDEWKSLMNGRVLS